MEAPLPFVPDATTRPAAPYPSLGESWGILGWYLLATLVAGGACYALLSAATALPRHLNVLGSAVAGNVALLFFLRWKAGPRWQPWRLRGQEPGWLYAAAPVVVLTSVTILSLLSFLHLPNTTSGLFQKLSQTPMVALLLGAVVVPVLEELLFRGVVLNGLLRRYRPWVAIGQSALLFGVVHFNPAQSLNAGLLGLLVGWLYYRTRSLGVCIVLHGLNNALGFIGMYLTPAARQDEPVTALFGSVGAYAGAVAGSGVVLAGLLWAVQRSTTPAAPVLVAAEAA